MAEYTAQDRAAIEQAFDDVETWLSTAPTGYEFHDHDDESGTTRVTRVHDAHRALDLLRRLLLDD